MQAPDSELLDEYTFRRYRPGDRETFLTLYEDILSDDSTLEWFRWKYERNPFVEHVPITVAESEGSVVAAVGSFSLDMQVGADTVPAAISSDGFVHPDHRQRGVFIRLLQSAWERYADQGTAFLFDLSISKATFQLHQKYTDWEMIQTIPRYYRIQRPGALLESETGSRLLGLGGRALKPVVRGYLGSGRHPDDPKGSDVSVERRDTVPTEALTSIYRASVPSTIHPVRNEHLYDWRFDNPHWEYRTYVARSHGRPVAGLIVGSRSLSGQVETRIVDALPLEPADRELELGLLLERALDDHDDAALVSVLPGTLPPALLKRFGFRSQTSFPLDRMTQPIRHGVCPFTVAEERDDLSDARLMDGANWQLSYIAHDSC